MFVMVDVAAARCSVAAVVAFVWQAPRTTCSFAEGSGAYELAAKLKMIWNQQLVGRTEDGERRRWLWKLASKRRTRPC